LLEAQRRLAPPLRRLADRRLAAGDDHRDLLLRGGDARVEQPLARQAELGKEAGRRPVERLADAVVREGVGLDADDAQAGAAELDGGGEPGEAAAEHGGVAADGRCWTSGCDRGWLLVGHRQLTLGQMKG